MAFYDVFLDAIPAYTGLSPVSFFTILSLMVGVYYLVCNVFFVSPVTVDPKRFVPMESISPPAAPVQLGDVCEEELRAYDGSDPKKPLLMAIKGQIYDVSRSRMFYGPGGPYALFAGRDASRALALMSFNTNDLTGNIEGLSPSELDTLQDWEYKFMEKYVKVGQIIKEKTESGEGENGEETAKEDESKVETEDIGENRKNEVTEKDGAESI